jgi:hypothetical protein
LPINVGGMEMLFAKGLGIKAAPSDWRRMCIELIRCSHGSVSEELVPEGMT